MNDILFVILRRLRRPLIVLIIAYAVSVWGLVLIPGVDREGNVVHLGFFHAFYFISYTATTIGFGELPFEFTDAQRAWTIFCIYFCVVSWAYALGSIFHLSQDQTFRDAIMRRRFALRVAAQQEPFIHLAGYGQSGIMLARMLDRMGWRLVIVEMRKDRAASIEITEFERTPDFLAADGRLPDVLVDAGVTHRKCVAMVVLVGNDENNQSVAICGTVLNPSLRIIARGHTPIAKGNLDSFKNIELINPYELIARDIGLDLCNPGKQHVIWWLSGLPGGQRPEPLNLPRGHWVVCGKGSFGRYIAAALETAGVTWSFADFDFGGGDGGAERDHHESALEVLMAAGLEHAVGLVAGTENDALNLATVTRARSVNPGIYVVIRQVNAANASLVEAAMSPLRFIRAEVVSHKARELLTSPLLIRFFRHVAEDNALAEKTTKLLVQFVGNNVPFMWVFDCYTVYPGLKQVLGPDTAPPLSIGDLLISPENNAEHLNAIPLLLLRKKQEFPCPDENTRLLPGDRILFAGRRNVEAVQKRFYLEPSPLAYVRTGVEPPRSWLFKELGRIRKRREHDLRIEEYAKHSKRSR